MLSFDWDDIKNDGLSLSQQINISDLPGLQALEEGEECQFLAPLSVDLRIYPAGDWLEVSGSLRSEVEVACNRCLKPFVWALSADFDLTLTRELPSVTDEEGEELEISAEEMGLVLVEDEEISLAELVSEQAVMAFPYRILCDEQCKGLCSQCGADLNQGPCQCRQENPLSKFATLKDFKVEK